MQIIDFIAHLGEYIALGALIPYVILKIIEWIGDDKHDSK